MTYKIDTKAGAGNTLEVHGLLDAAALETIRAMLSGRAGTLRVVLKEGCRVEPAILEELRRTAGVELIAESPFLARWLGTI